MVIATYATPPAGTPSIWICLGACALGLAYLLPNHVPPWTAFHSDLWAALVLSAAGLAACVRWRAINPRIAPPALVAFACAGLVSAQVVTGVIHHSGHAWVWVLYFLGAGVACTAGNMWGQNSPQEPADLVFGALLFAGIASVGLALHQWFELPAVGPWIMQPVGPRMHANLGQANQLGSLLVLALLALAWFSHRRQIGAAVGIFAAVYLVLGIVMSASRTAWLNLAVVLVLAYCFRTRAETARWVPVAVLVLVLTSLGFVLRPVVDAWGGYEGPSAIERGAGSDARLSIWMQMLAAIGTKSWGGWGAGQVYQAQMESLDHSVVFTGGALLSSAHNLFLDFMLWFGVPAGVCLSAVLVCWFAWVGVSSRSPVQAVIFTALVVLAVHAMLELPLHYAYFLLPFFLLGGVLDASIAGVRRVSIGSRSQIAMLTVTVMMLLATARDYLRVEASMYGLRFEAARVASIYSPDPPDVWILGQWRDFIILSRLDPFAPVSPEVLRWANSVAMSEPTTRVLRNVAIMAAVAGQRDAAQRWLIRSCLILPSASCHAMRDSWAQLSLQSAAVATVPWPPSATALLKP